MSRFRNRLSQPSRLLALVAYLAVLLLLALYLNGRVLPPFGLEGLWFWAAFAALLLGELLLEPFFTSPKDAIANSVAVGIAAASLSAEGADVSEDAVAVGRLIVGGVALAIIVISAASILLKDRSEPARRVARILRTVASGIGSAAFLFSLVLLSSGYAAFADDSAKVATLYTAWFLIVAAEPVERLLWAITQRAQSREQLGEVTRVEDPGIVVARIPPGDHWKVGTRVSVGARASPGIVVDITTSADDALARIALHEAQAAIRVGSTIRLAGQPASTALVGHVGPGSSSDDLVVDAAPATSTLGLREGRLMSAPLGEQAALFQIVRGEVVARQEEELRRDLIRITARKLGIWDESTTSFSPVPWVPDTGRPVELLALRDQPVFDARRIGFVPETEFGISVDVHAAVTHNTAILGILGIGKTHLAWELMKRMLADGIRVIALDITGRYARQFLETCPPAVQTAFERFIEERIEADADNATVRDHEAGNLKEFKDALEDALGIFMQGNSRLLIINPNRFRVTRMVGNPYAGEANRLAELSMVDITALIAEELLRIAQVIDAEERADGRITLDAEESRARICIVLEEAHSLVPEWNSVSQEGERSSVAITSRAILQGRKYGYGCLLITQRTANVTKSILNQCNTILALRNYDATGVGFLENYIGPAYAQTLATLEDREAVVFGRASSCNAPIIVRLNEAARFQSGYWEYVVDDVPITQPPPPEDPVAFEVPIEEEPPLTQDEGP